MKKYLLVYALLLNIVAVSKMQPSEPPMYIEELIKSGFPTKMEFCLEKVFIHLPLSMLYKKYVKPTCFDSKKPITLDTRYGMITLPISPRNISSHFFENIAMHCIYRFFLVYHNDLCRMTQYCGAFSTLLDNVPFIKTMKTCYNLKEKVLFYFNGKFKNIPLSIQALKVINIAGSQASMDLGERLAKKYGVINAAEKYLGTIGKIAAKKLSCTIGSALYSIIVGTACTCFDKDWNVQKPSLPDIPMFGISNKERRYNPEIGCTIDIDYRPKKTWLETIAASINLKFFVAFPCLKGEWIHSF